MPDDGHDDRTPKVTPHLLARGHELCPRRLAHELDGRRPDAGAFNRWRIRTPFVAAASHAHRGGRRPAPADLPAPPDLEPEEVHVWERATAGYLARFGDVPATAIDHGCEQPTRSTRYRVRVGGAVDVLVRVDADGALELRQVELWGPAPDADPHRNWEIALAVLRLATRLSGERLRIHHVDVLGDTGAVAHFDYETDLVPLREAFATRLGELRARADAQHAVAGTECGQCRHIAGCPAHRDARADREGA
jgi:hypothetical protein